MTQVSSLYLHVPFCRHLCNYCDFYKRSFDQPAHQIEEFHQFLRASLTRHEALMQESHVSWGHWETIYLGGGTPSLWGADGASFFAEHLSQPRTSDAEFTMEIDPGTWTPDLIASWQKLGLNRISIGTQTLNPEFLRIMDRAHSLAESEKLLQYCQQEGWNFSLDFLLGLPYSKEKKRDIKSELDQLLKFSPKHISLYILNARSHYTHSQALPDDEFIREEYLLVSDYLQECGFHHYEVSNFALPGFESRHNLKYWRGQSVAALGPTGTGLFHLGQDSALRYKWKVSAPEVEKEFLGKEELSLENTYLSLRTSEGWEPDEPELYSKIFENWQQQSWGEFRQGRMILNARGFVILDSLMDDLFRVQK